MKRILAIVVGMALALAASPSWASTDTGGASTTVYTDLTVSAATAPTSTDLATIAAQSGTSSGTIYCKSITGSEWRMNTTDSYVVWKIWNHTHWCYNYSRVESVTGYTDIYTGPGWSGDNKGWYAAWWDKPLNLRTHATAHFTYAPGGYVIQTASPDLCLSVGQKGGSAVCGT